jgi:hypothetical protein
MPSQLFDLRFGYACNERQMVIYSPFRVAVAPPAANLAMRSRLGVKLAAALLHSPFEAISDSAIVRSIIRIPEHLRFEARSGRHYVSKFGRELLRVRQQVGIQAYLEDGIPFCLARELRIDYLIRPCAECARLLDSAQNIQTSAPPASFESALCYHGRAAAHCIEGLCEGIRVDADAVYVDNVKAARLKML